MEATHVRDDRVAAPRAERLAAIRYAASWTLADFVVADDCSAESATSAAAPRAHTLAHRTFGDGLLRIVRDAGDGCHDAVPAPP